jgi:hypothetical protein
MARRSNNGRLDLVARVPPVAGFDIKAAGNRQEWK